MQRKIQEVTALDKKTLIEAGLKLSEEVGELAEAILVTSNVSACGYKENITAEDVLYEAADAVIVASSIAYKAGFSVDDLEMAVLKKLEKWKQKIAEVN